jgi:hypothetical protein
VFGQEFTSRGLPCGATVEAVIAQEGRPTNSYIQDDGDIRLTYDSVSNAGADYAGMELLFRSNKLIRAEYRYSFWNEDEPYALNIFQSLERNLRNLYGTPTDGTHLTLSRNSEIWGLEWIFSRTRILYVFSRDEYTHRGSIKYESPYLNAFGGL